MEGNSPDNRQQSNEAQLDELDQTLAALAALPTARRPALEQYERLEQKLAEYSETWNHRKVGGVVVALREYNASGEVVVDDRFLKGMRVCASALWELAYFRPDEA